MMTVHLICGATGAGKTTYAAALAQRIGAVRFGIDEWMTTLFMADAAPAVTAAWAAERVSRCELQMWATAEMILARGVDVIFDVGLLRREDRDRLRARAAGAGATAKMHYLDVDRDVRRARLVRRTGAAAVTDRAFEALEASFEPPLDDELAGAFVIHAD
jgi:predicted kinase